MIRSRVPVGPGHKRPAAAILSRLRGKKGKRGEWWQGWRGGRDAGAGGYRIDMTERSEGIGWLGSGHAAAERSEAAA
ncbi:hypothetical protein GCM10009779_06460 [Polymorphospora rubra]|uniref:Uncharacterized protein n=1 Tax=Polymorphospora rubra TaxID=338584 RepID=A0A810NF53_9ACTN|nr:hypothetical protein Prubr_69160 [Polymorphospora rubra]